MSTAHADSDSAPLNVYEVGMGTHKLTVEAPDAGSAAMYYGLACVNTNNPFMAAVYTENGEPYTGEIWWLNFAPDEAFVESVVNRLPEDWHKQCRVIEEGQVDNG